MWGNFDDLPAEVKAVFLEQQKQHELARMQSEADTHELMDTLETFDKRQLQFIARVMDHIATAPGKRGIKYATHLEGIALGLAHEKYSVCLVHNLTHGEDDLFDKDTSIKVEDMPVHIVEPGEIEGQQELAFGAATVAQWQADMDKFGVESNPLAGQPGELPFRCSRCGIGIHSLEDRMLRPADEGGCAGCRHKATNG